MRKLKGTDIFKMGRIVRELDLKEELKKFAFENDSAEAAIDNMTETQGFELVYTIFDKAMGTKAEDLIIDFVADLGEMTPEKAKEMEMDEFLDLIEEIGKGIAWRDFFTRVARFLDLKSLR